MKMKVHPAATLMPKLSTSAFVQLKDDIERHGLREPIWMKNGKIDGRHRWRACQELGIKCDTKEFAGDDVEAFVMSANLHRRHLTKRAGTVRLSRGSQKRPSRTDRDIGRWSTRATSLSPPPARLMDRFDHRERLQASGRRARGRKPADRPVLTHAGRSRSTPLFERLAACTRRSFQTWARSSGHCANTPSGWNANSLTVAAPGERAAASMKPAR